MHNESPWNELPDSPPPITDVYRPKLYVLAIDGKDRMSVGFCMRQYSGYLHWTFAKPIGNPTHWAYLPQPPARSQSQTSP